MKQNHGQPNNNTFSTGGIKAPTQEFNDQFAKADESNLVVMESDGRAGVVGKKYQEYLDQARKASEERQLNAAKEKREAQKKASEDNALKRRRHKGLLFSPLEHYVLNIEYEMPDTN